MSGDIRQGPSDISTGSFKPAAADDDIRQGVSDVRGPDAADPLTPSPALFPSTSLYPH